MQKKIYKVLTPVPKRDGTKWWMRVGNGYDNKDASINLYLDAMPLHGGPVTLQLRELDENDLREREARRNASARSSAPPSGTFTPPGKSPTAEIPF